MGVAGISEVASGDDYRIPDCVQGNSMIYVIYGGGSPLEIESYSPEVAEAQAVEQYGFDVSNLVTVEKKDVMLPGRCDAGFASGADMHADSI